MRLIPSAKIGLTRNSRTSLSQANDLSFEHPNDTFEIVARKQGIVIENTPQGRLFEKMCREVWDRERLKA